MSEEKEMSRGAAVALGCFVALVGIVIVVVAFTGSAERFHAPRWVVGCSGASFVFFGAWTAALYAGRYDPKRSEETLPPRPVQLAVLIPALLCFAAPFHWIAFWPGPREFSATFSVPGLAARHGTAGWSGRIMFGIGAVLIDLMIVVAVMKLVKPRAR